MVRRAIILKSAKPGGAGDAAGRRQRAAAAAASASRRNSTSSSPTTRTACRDGFVAVEIIGAEEAGTDVADFSILSNSRNVGDFASRSISGDGKKAVIQVPVEDGENKISITGINEFGYLTERSVVALAKKTDERREEGQALRRRGRRREISVPARPTAAAGPATCATPSTTRPSSCDVLVAEIGAALLRHGSAGAGQPRSRSTRRPTLARRHRRDRRRRRRAGAGIRQRSTTRSPISSTSRPPTTRPSSSSPATASTSTRTTISSRPTAANRMPTSGSAPRWSNGPTSRRRSSAPKACASCCSTPATPPTPSIRGSKRTRPMRASSCSRRPPPTAPPPSCRNSATASSPIRCSKGCAARPTPAATACTLLGLADYIYREVTQAHQRAAEAVLLHQQHGEHPACASREPSQRPRQPAVGSLRGCLALRVGAVCAGGCSRIQHAALRFAAAALPARRCRLSALLRQTPTCSTGRSPRSPTIRRRTSGSPASPCRIICWPTGWSRSVSGRRPASLQAHRHPDARPFPQGGQAVRHDEARLRDGQGKVATDADAVSRLLEAGDWIEENPACSTRITASARCCPS